MAFLTKRLGPYALTLLLAATAARAQQPHSYVADANHEYTAIFSRPDNPCPTEQTTAGYANCIGKQLTFTDAHLAAFLTAVRGIVAHEDTGQRATIALGGNELELLNRADAAWREYRKNTCALVRAGFWGGSGMGNAGSECEYRTDRQYAQQVADAVSLKILAE